MSRSLALPDFFLGLLYLAGVLVLLALAARAIGHRWLGVYAGADRFVAYSVVAVCLCIAVHLAPALVGVLSRAGVLGAAALIAIASALAARRGSPSAPRSQPSVVPPIDTGTAVAMAAVAAAFLVGVLAHARTAPENVDLVTFDLPTLAAWIQTGSIWTTVDLMPLFSHGAYPQNGLLVDMLLALPWRTTALARMDALILFPVLGVAVHAASRELHGDASAAVRMALMVLAIPAVFVFALFEALPDVLMLSMFSAGTLFLLRHHRTRASQDVVLASLALGVAFGTKWYGVVASPSVLLAWAAMTPHARWRPFLLASAGTALAGGFWVVRNAVLYGNPLYPLGLSVFGVPLLDGPPDLLRERLTQPILTYVFDLRVMLFEVIPDMGRWQALVGLTALIGLVAAVARLRRLTDRRVRWCVLAAVVVLVAYVVNPDGTIGVTGEPFGIGINSRYFLPSVILALVVLPAVAPRLASGRVAAPAVLCSVLIGCRALSTAQLAVLLGAGAVIAAACHHTSTPARLARWAGLGVAAWLVGVASWLLLSEPIGRNQQFVADPAVGWVYRHAPDGARIGIAGAWNTDRVISPTLALHGPRLRNRVTYVAAGTGLLDPYLERDDWVAAVKSGRFDLLFVGREPIPFVGDRAPGWAEQEFGQVRVAESDFFRLYDLRGG